MMKKVVLFVLVGIFFCTGISHLVFAQDEQVAKQLADKAAMLIQEAKAEEIYSLLTPEMRSSVSQDYIRNTLNQLNSLYGKVISQEFKSTASGEKYQANRTINISRYWYKTITKKYPEGVYTIVEISFENDKVTLAAFSMVTFPGGKVPSQLQ